MRDDPLVALWRGAVGSAGEEAVREAAIARFGFAVPDAEAVAAIRDVSPLGVVEVGAGTGYWAHLLHEAGVDVVAYDIAPPPSEANTWFAGSTAWFAVQEGDHGVVSAHGDRTLLLVWPTRNEDWAADAARLFAAAGGSTLAYVGEPPGGRSGDDRFHALVGELDRCLSCAYDIPTAPCVCGTTPLFRPTKTVNLPHWTTYEDNLHLYTRAQSTNPLGPTPQRPTRRRWW